MTVKLTGLLVAFAGMVPSVASAETLYLTCQQVRGPEHTFADIYANPAGITKERYLEDLWNSDVSAFTMEPAQTWIVDLDAGKVTTPENTLTYKIKDRSRASINANFRNDEGAMKVWSLNRISGELKAVALLPQSWQESWKQAHGKAFPNYWSWTYRCTSSTKLKM